MLLAIDTAVPAACPSCIIVRDNLQLEAAIDENPAQRQAVSKLVNPLGIRLR